VKKPLNFTDFGEKKQGFAYYFFGTIFFTPIFPHFTLIYELFSGKNGEISGNIFGEISKEYGKIGKI
jgi:hypothetical protein